MLIVTDLQGNSEPLIDTQGTAIRQRVNENYELSFTTIKVKENQHAYDLLQHDAMLTVDNENFIIKNVNEMPFSKNVLALHEFFEIVDDFVEAKLVDGDYTIQQALAHAFSQAASWSWVVDDAFDSKFLSGFGADNPLSLLNQIIEIYGAEYTVTSIGKALKIKKKIGVQTDEQVRFKHNLSSIQRDVDSSSVKTAMNVRYALDEFGTYTRNVVYISPNSNNYRRLKWAEPLHLDHIYNESEALAIAATQIQDVPLISIATTFAEIKNSGYNADNMTLGNSFYLIDERMNLNESVRIIEIESYPFDEGKSPYVVCSNARKVIENINVSQQQQQNSLNREAVKQGSIYNGAIITETDGILINGKNGVRIRLNADLGFLIDKNGAPEFYVDTSGNLNFDGRLNISDNGQTLLEAYMDTYGGRLIINDADGAQNVKIGSESGSGNNNRGGTLVLYDDDVTKPRVQASILAENGGGAINLRNQNGNSKIGLYAENQQQPLLVIFGANNTPSTYFTDVSGVIGGKTVATEDWVLNVLPNINNLATRQWVEDNFEPKTP